jgi:hypothetical protein
MRMNSFKKKNLEVTATILKNLGGSGLWGIRLQKEKILLRIKKIEIK